MRCARTIKPDGGIGGNTHGPREVLNELKWHRQALERALVHYVHRPEGERVVIGADIVALGPDSFERRTRSHWRPGRIPYHRVTRIELDGAIVWERRVAQPE